MIDSFARLFFQNGSGFVFQTLLSDMLFVGIIVYLITAVAVPAIVPVIKPVIKTVIAFRHVAKDIGGPKPHWLYGNWELGLDHQGMLNLAETCKTYPIMCTIYRSILGVVATYHPDIAKKILSASYPKSVFSNFIKIAFRDGLVTSSGELWKRHRRLLTPVFHYGILKGYGEIFSKNCNIVLEAFENASQTGKPYDITVPISKMTFANMMECIMSQTVHNDLGMQFSHKKSQELSTILVSRCVNPIFWFDGLFYLSKQGRAFKEVYDRFEDVVAKIVNERRALLASMQGQNDSSSENVFTDEATGQSYTFRKHKGKPMDFLDILIQTKDEDGKGLTDKEIFDEVATFFIGGQDTVTTALSWILYHLSMNEDCQEKCRNEIENVVGQKEELELSDLSKLIYVTQCIKESLRLNPPIHTIARTLTDDLTISHPLIGNKEVTLKKGTTAVVNIYALHHNLHVWENPEVFDAERFSPTNLPKIPPFAHIPFAAGPRNCIGQNFALTEIKIFLSHVLRRYKFVYPPNTPKPKMKVGLALTPANGLQLIVKPVEV